MSFRRFLAERVDQCDLEVWDIHFRASTDSVEKLTAKSQSAAKSFVAGCVPANLSSPFRGSGVGQGEKVENPLKGLLRLNER